MSLFITVLTAAARQSNEELIGWLTERPKETFGIFLTFIYLQRRPFRIWVATTAARRRRPASAGTTCGWRKPTRRGASSGTGQRGLTAPLTDASGVQCCTVLYSVHYLVLHRSGEINIYFQIQRFYFFSKFPSFSTSGGNI